MRIAVLSPPMFSARVDVQRILKACRRGATEAGHEVEVVSDPSEAMVFDLLVLWGAGHPDMADATRFARSVGAHTLCWDIGYWGRSSTNGYFRMAIDAGHADALVMRRDRDGSRLAKHGITLRSDFDPRGPIILVGMGWKSARQYGERVGAWEAAKAAEIVGLMHGRRLVFRPKPGNAQNCRAVRGFEVDDRPIEDVLRGASLVVCRHSNVAIDAIVAGVPVITEGGVAAAVCPRSLETKTKPLPNDIRRRFLANLAWFQWTAAEMAKPETWTVFREMIDDLEVA